MKRLTPLFPLVLILSCQFNRKSDDRQLDHLQIRGLRPFLNALRLLEARGDRLVRILFIGDSTISGDNVTLQLRNLMTDRFGYGGAGLVNPGREAHLRQQEARVLSRASGLLRIPFSVFHLPEFPELGFTGYSYRLSDTLHVKSRQPPEMIRLIVRGPPGPIQISGRLAIESSQKQSGPCRLFSVDDDFSNDIIIQTRGNGNSLFLDGLILENRAGLTLSPIVQLGLHQAWMQGIPLEHLKCGLGLYAPDLIILQSGINEAETMRAGRRPFDPTVYREQLLLWLQKLKKAYQGPVILFGPPERLVVVRGQRIPQAEIPIISSIQEEVARELGFAFFDTYHALRGAGSMLQMIERREAHADGTHLTYAGGERLARLFFTAILKAYGL